MGAGLEHFGRGVGISADGIIVVIDPNSTSLLFAKAAKDMVEEIKSGAELSQPSLIWNSPVMLKKQGSSPVLLS